MIPDGRTPVVVVTGFLGSGKTTLVNRLVSKEPHCLVIVNEFGEIAVDHYLLEAGEFVAVQGVRHVFDRLRPVSVTAGTGLVFITRGLEEREVRALWQAMSDLRGSS